MTVKFVYCKAPSANHLEVQPIHPGQCHCGAVKFKVNLPNGLENPARCNCSICKRHGALMGFVDIEDFIIEEGEDVLSLYQFNTGVAKHYFCSRCGIYTHHQRRSVPTQYAFNVACLDGIDPYTLADVPVIDGAGHHPNDNE